MFEALARDVEAEQRRSSLPFQALQEGQDYHPLGETRPKEEAKVSMKEADKKGATGTGAGASASASAKTTTGKKVVMDDPLSVFAMKGTGARVAPGLDPLSMMGGGGGGDKASSDPLSDPLSMLSVGTAAQNKAAATKLDQQAADLAMEREAERNRLVLAQARFKERIRSDYKFAGNIKLQAGAMDATGSQGLIVDGAGAGGTARQADIYEDRLRLLEKKNEKYDYVELSQKDYEDHVHQLVESLDRAWSRDERVQSLKIAIQMAKLLGDSTVPIYYPTIFVIVTDALEEFGKKVYDRLRRKCEEVLAAEAGLSDTSTAAAKLGKQLFPDEFTVVDVPQAAKEIARNWFYKASCIRDLVPRLYVEVTLARCYRFLMDETKYQNELDRIALQMRGLGEPLIATYARAYLVHIGEKLVGRAPLSPCPDFSFQTLEDTCMLEADMLNASLKAHIKKTGISVAQYKSLMMPAVEWLLMSVANGANKDTFRRTLAAYQVTMTDKRNYAGGSATLLKYIVECFDAGMYSAQTLEMAALAKNACVEDSPVSTIMLFTSLVKKLSLHPPEAEDHRNKLLNSAWRSATSSPEEELVPFVECAAAVLELIQRHYKGHEIPRILQDLVGRIEGREHCVPDAVVRQFEIIVVGLFSAPPALISRVLTSDSLLKILDVFKGPKRISVCQQILHALKNMPRTGDPILIATLFEIGRNIHDSIDRLTAEVDVSYSASLISSFVDKIDFGNDLEQQLSSYVECRAAFTNLDAVKDKLVLCVSGLAMRANALMKGKHSRKTTSFVKACMAFCHITIPSISVALRKFDLTVHCAQVALQCQCLPQTDTLLRATAKLIPEVPTHVVDSSTGRKKPTSEGLLESIRVLLSFLVTVPGNPEYGPFYIVNMLLRELPRYEWPAGSTYGPRIMMDILALMCTYAQETHPYHVPHVEANDVLYSGDGEYRTELNTRIQQCMSAIESQLVEYEDGDGAAQLSQARLVLDLVNQLASRVVLSDTTSNYVLMLMQKANLRKGLFTRADQRYFALTLAFLRHRADECGATSLISGLGLGAATSK